MPSSSHISYSDISRLSDTLASVAASSASRISARPSWSSSYIRNLACTAMEYSRLKRDFFTCTVDSEARRQAVPSAGSFYISTDLPQSSDLSASLGSLIRGGRLAGVDRKRATYAYRLKHIDPSRRSALGRVASAIVDDQRRIHREFNPSAYSDASSSQDRCVHTLTRGSSDETPPHRHRRTRLRIQLREAKALAHGPPQCQTGAQQYSPHLPQAEAILVAFGSSALTCLRSTPSPPIAPPRSTCRSAPQDLDLGDLVSLEQPVIAGTAPRSPPAAPIVDLGDTFPN